MQPPFPPSFPKPIPQIPMSLPAGLTWRPDCRPQHTDKKSEESAPTKTTGSEPTAAGKTGTAGTTGATQTPAKGQQGDPCMEMLPMMAVMFVIIYFLMIRPNQKREKTIKAMRTTLKKGDKVVTTGGMHGIVTKVDETTVTLQTDAEGRVRMTFDVTAVGRRIEDEAAPTNDAGATKTN